MLNDASSPSGESHDERAPRDGDGRVADATGPASEVFIALGSNVGDRLENLRSALSAMEAAGIHVGKISSVYETDPLGPDQPDYLNAVCLARTQLSPAALLEVLKRIEHNVGRVPRQRWGPREIDLDILLIGNQIIDTEDLKVPHPELVNRPFVLIPLIELDPHLELPSGRPAAGFLRDTGGVRLFSDGVFRSN